MSKGATRGKCDKHGRHAATSKATETSVSTANSRPLGSTQQHGQNYRPLLLFVWIGSIVICILLKSDLPLVAMDKTFDDSMPTIVMNVSAASRSAPAAAKARPGSRIRTRQAGHAPLQRYKEKVQRALNRSPDLDRRCSADPNVQSRLSALVGPAFDCLRKSAPRMTSESLVYPIADAHAHFNELRMIASQWAQHGGHKYHDWGGYAGPWIENHFITHLESMYDKRMDEVSASPGASHFCLQEVFGPYIPILVPWTDHYVNRQLLSVNLHVPDVRRLWPLLQRKMRPNVPYILLVQNAQGLKATVVNLNMAAMPNVLVLSAGGYGHVPVPLLKQAEDALVTHSSSTQATAPPPAYGLPSEVPRPLRKHPTNRTFVATYVGGDTNAPAMMRENLIKGLQALDEDPMANAINKSKLRIFSYYKGHAWREFMARSCFSLCPRGFGRTSYHFMEALQMGLIPIHVYRDVPWVPYLDFMQREQLAIAVRYDEVENLMRNVLLTSLSSTSTSSSSSQHDSWTLANIEETEQRILSYRESHFSFEGALNHIHAFMVDTGKSDLQCQRLPDSALG